MTEHTQVTSQLLPSSGDASPPPPAQGTQACRPHPLRAALKASPPAPPSRQEQQFVPFARKINCGTGVDARTSNEAVTPTGKVGTWKTKQSSSGSIACHAALAERFLKSRLCAHSGRQSGGKPARCILPVSNYIFHILFISSKETSNYYTILSPYHFGRFINYNLGERPHVRLQMRLIKDIF